MSLIKNFVKKVFPDLTEDEISMLYDELIKLGADTPTDVKYLAESDILCLPPIKIRKLIAAANEEGCSIVPPAAQIQSTNDNSTHTESEMNILICKMPFNVQEAIRGEEYVTTKKRLGAVKVIGDYLAAKNDGKYSIPRDVVRKFCIDLVNAHPKSFQDTGVDGEVIGKGYGSLLLQVDNHCRNILKKQRKTLAQPSPKRTKRPTAAEKYGCVETAPSSTTNEYTDIRVAIETNVPIREIMEKFPTFLSPENLLAHYNTLTASDITNSVEIAKDNNMAELFCFLLSKQGTNKQIHKICLRNKSGERNILVLTMLLAGFFKEDTSVFIPHEEAYEDGELKDGNIHVLYKARGSDILDNDTEFDIAVDRNIIFTKIISKDEIITLLFALFFVFNLAYPKGMEATMELLQRSIFGINPDGGSGTKGDTKKLKVDGVNTKVLSLLCKVKAFKI